VCIHQVGEQVLTDFQLGFCIALYAGSSKPAALPLYVFWSIVPFSLPLFLLMFSNFYTCCMELGKSTQPGKWDRFGRFLSTNMWGSSSQIRCFETMRFKICNFSCLEVRVFSKRILLFKFFPPLGRLFPGGIGASFIGSARYLLDTSFLLGFSFDPEYGADMFFRNVGWLSPDYTALYPRRYISSTFLEFLWKANGIPI
jgi:hypothetical protein